jgi:hypothetical protein
VYFLGKMDLLLRLCVPSVHVSTKPGQLQSEVAASGNLEQDSEHPLAATLYAFSVFHCLTVSLAQGGAGLGAMWGQAAREMLSEAGFGKITVEHLDRDILNAYYICTAGARS